jgi:SAM-dependent methyltransferase
VSRSESQKVPGVGGFASTAAYHDRYRLAYPERLIARVANLADLKPGDAVLDLGCGTGMLAIPFAQAGMAVTAMDPEPEMLTAAQAAAQAACVTATWIKGGSENLTPSLGSSAAVRRSFMMDRRDAGHVGSSAEPEGCVALFHDAHPPVGRMAGSKSFVMSTKRRQSPTRRPSAL